MKAQGRTSLVLFGLALGVRLILVVLLGPVMEPDSFGYDNLARNLADGRGYVDTRPFAIADAALMRTPLYPVFLAGIYTLAGKNVVAVAVVQQIFAAASIVLLYRISVLVVGAALARATGLVLVFHPWLAITGNAVMTETLFTFLLSAAIWFLLRGIDEDSWRALGACGLFLGLSALCRPTLLLFTLAVPLLALPRQHIWPAVTKRILCVWLPFAVVICPWVYRNYRVYGYPGVAPIVGTVLLMRVAPEPAELRGNDAFEEALRESCLAPKESVVSVIPNTDEYRAHLRLTSATIPCAYAAMRVLAQQGHSLPEIDREFFRIAAREIRRHPVRYLRGALYQAGFLWSGYPTEWLGGSFDQRLRDNLKAGGGGVVVAKVVCRLLLGLVLAAATALGAALLLRSRNRFAVVPVVLLAYITFLTACLNVAELRFRLPFEPFAVMLAVYAVAHLARFGARERWSTPTGYPAD